MSNTDHPDYPAEYQKGEVTFYGKTYFVDESVLIPRLETEVLVKKAREYLQTHSVDVIVDMGSWSGIIGTSLADQVSQVIFVDISAAALALSRKNFEQHFWQKPAMFLCSHLFENFPLWDLQGKRVLYVANLPYIRDGDRGNMSPDTAFEPSVALFGWPRTGFELYETFFRKLKEKELLDGGSASIIEFGYDQRELAGYILRLFPWKTTFFADYSGIERFAMIEGGDEQWIPFL